jgi:hypothetical protein
VKSSNCRTVNKIKSEKRKWSERPDLNWYDTITANTQVYNTQRAIDIAESEKRIDSLTINVIQPDLFVRHFRVSVFRKSQTQSV